MNIIAFYSPFLGSSDMLASRLILEDAMDFQKELIAEFDRELALTRKMLDAVPADADLAWKANPKSMMLGRLAGHVAETPCQWAIHTLTMDKLEFGPDHKWESYVPASKQALLDLYDKESAEARAALVALDPTKWDENWKMVAMGETWIDDSRYGVWRTWVMNHMIHHRAQLGRDLRALGEKIPGMYGPSADEG